MWEIKKFKTLEEQNKWIENNKHRVQYEIIFISNGYAVEYRKLKIIDIR